MIHASSKSAQNILTVIGLNPDTVLDNARLQALQNATHIYCGARHQALVRAQLADTAAQWHLWQSPIQLSLDQLSAQVQDQQKIVILASGDPLCYGIASTIIRQYPDFTLDILPAPSSFSLAAAKLQWPLQHTVCISLHHQDETAILQHLRPQQRILALTKNRHSPLQIAQILCDRGWGESRVTVLQELASREEHIDQMTAVEIVEDQPNFLNLHILAVEAIKTLPENVTKQVFLPDQQLHHDGQLTKFAFRAITIAALDPAEGKVLWDIGAGCGSISAQWIRYGGKAIAIEKSANRCAFIRDNTAFAAQNCIVHEGNAQDILPQLLAGGASPTAIFFGGCLELIPSVLEILPTGAVLVANAVTLPSQSRLIALRQKIGGSLRRIAIEEETSIANFPALKPARSILQFTWTKP